MKKILFFVATYAFVIQAQAAAGTCAQLFTLQAQGPVAMLSTSSQSVRMLVAGRTTAKDQLFSASLNVARVVGVRADVKSNNQIYLRDAHGTEASASFSAGARFSSMFFLNSASALLLKDVRVANGFITHFSAGDISQVDLPTLNKQKIAQASIVGVEYSSSLPEVALAESARVVIKMKPVLFIN